MKIAWIAAIVVSAAVAVPVLAQVTADDFLPPVTGGPVDVKEPGKVRVKGDVVEAATAQDAINAAVQRNTEDLRGGDTPEVGAKMVKFPSGLGFVATGVSVYRTMENPVATRIAKRKAYVIAFTQAKKNLAEILDGLTNEGRETIRESLSNVNLPDEEMTNIATHSEEAVQQAVDMMLRGFVVYQVKDDEAQKAVYVSIVTTPKTRGKLARPAAHVVEADDLREGLNQVIAEVKTGVVPPIGGRIIRVWTTGETAFVGFGSSVVRTSDNAAVQARLNLSAQKIAAMRAKDALCGLIIGDKASWHGDVVETMRDEIREYEVLDEGDPLKRDDPANYRKLEQARQTFIARLEATDVYRSARRGVLPAGVNTKTWFDEDNAWAYGMSVYAPSLTEAAAKAAREMREADLLRPSAEGGPEGFTDEKDRDVKRPGEEVKPGPTGKVSEDEGL